VIDTNDYMENESKVSLINETRGILNRVRLFHICGTMSTDSRYMPTQDDIDRLICEYIDLTSSCGLFNGNHEPMKQTIKYQLFRTAFYIQIAGDVLLSSLPLVGTYFNRNARVLRLAIDVYRSYGESIEGSNS